MRIGRDEAAYIPPNVKTSGRALPEVSEVYQEAAVEFIGYLACILDYVIT